MSDLPLLDAARHRIGDPDASVRQRRRSAATAVERARMDDVVDYLLQNDDDPESPLNLLRRESLREDLVDEAALPSRDPDLLAGPFSHIVVDEAQELTDAQWQMLVRRCPSRSFTIAGDRAQARHGFSESWQERLQRVGFDRVAVATLSINYRTPVEVMAEAEPVIRELLPDANVPTSIRSSGSSGARGPTSELRAIVDDWLATHDGVACVIGDPTYAAAARPVPRSGALQGTGVRPRRPRRPRALRRRHRGHRGPLRLHDTRDPGAGDPERGVMGPRRCRFHKGCRSFVTSPGRRATGGDTFPSSLEKPTTTRTRLSSRAT
jgi:hypothetical protein